MTGLSTDLEKFKYMEGTLLWKPEAGGAAVSSILSSDQIFFQREENILGNRKICTVFFEKIRREIERNRNKTAIELTSVKYSYAFIPYFLSIPLESEELKKSAAIFFQSSQCFLWAKYAHSKYISKSFPITNVDFHPETGKIEFPTFTFDFRLRGGHCGAVSLNIRNNQDQVFLTLKGYACLLATFRQDQDNYKLIHSQLHMTDSSSQEATSIQSTNHAKKKRKPNSSEDQELENSASLLLSISNERQHLREREPSQRSPVAQSTAVYFPGSDLNVGTQAMGQIASNFDVRRSQEQADLDGQLLDLQRRHSYLSPSISRGTPSSFSSPMAPSFSLPHSNMSVQVRGQMPSRFGVMRSQEQADLERQFLDLQRRHSYFSPSISHGAPSSFPSPTASSPSFRNPSMNASTSFDIMQLLQTPVGASFLQPSASNPSYTTHAVTYFPHLSSLNQNLHLVNRVDVPKVQGISHSPMPSETLPSPVSQAVDAYETQGMSHSPMPDETQVASTQAAQAAIQSVPSSQLASSIVEQAVASTSEAFDELEEVRKKIRLYQNGNLSSAVTLLTQAFQHVLEKEDTSTLEDLAFYFDAMSKSTELSSGKEAKR